MDTAPRRVPPANAITANGKHMDTNTNTRTMEHFFRCGFTNEELHSNQRTQDTIQQLQQINNEIQRQWTIGTQGLDNANKLHFQNQTGSDTT